MSGKLIMVFTLSAALLLSSAASSPGEAAQADVMQRLLAKSERAGGRQQLTPHAARVERRTQLSEYEREIMTKQIMQAISGLMNSECMLDRDYQGWVDFGRRDTE